jgi:hypothetical protein
MATLQQAELTLEWTRTFFEGELKSSNKQYEGWFALYTEKNKRAVLEGSSAISMDEAKARANTRNTNQTQSATLTPNDNLGNTTPVQFGQVRVNSNHRYGNCGAVDGCQNPRLSGDFRI